jgi:hypothetical protein
VTVLAAIVRHFDPDWAVCGSHELRSAQRPPKGSAPWLGTTTYRRGDLASPPGAVTSRVGNGTIVDFTDHGRSVPADAVVLAASAVLGRL